MERCLVGLIGCNILKSLSPALHEDAFAAAGVKGHYHLMDLDVLGDRTDFARLFEAVRIGGFAGTNVTFPFKETVLQLLDEVSPEAKQIGAVNTVVIGRDAMLGEFEDFWSVTLGDDIVYVDGGDLFPTCNGDETYTLLTPLRTVVDGPTPALVVSTSIERTDASMPASDD